MFMMNRIAGDNCGKNWICHRCKWPEFLRNSEKANGNSFPPYPPRIVAMVRRDPEEEKGERGHSVTCVISVKKLDNCPRLRLVNLPAFRLEVLFPRPGNIISGRIIAV
ncbi:uncharacterized protein TNCV_1020351 [Trichonephila clavipes]|nr:uncharacterized protein TNCV_1020351 [Trichonephila clavipes]